MDPISIAMLLGKIGAGIGKAKAVAGAASAAGGSGGLGSLLKGLAGKSMMAGRPFRGGLLTNPEKDLIGGPKTMEMRPPIFLDDLMSPQQKIMQKRNQFDGLSSLLSQQPQQQMQPIMLQNIPDASGGMAYEQTPMVQGFGGRY